MPVVKEIITLLYNFAGAAFYTFMLIYVYNHCKKMKTFFKYTEAYGKCGLTNYSMQGIVGVIVFLFCRVSFLHYNFTFIVLFAIIFFIIQLFFCYQWLKYFKNGPMEYLWRCATERRILDLRVNR